MLLFQVTVLSLNKFLLEDFPGGTMDKNLPANARDMGLIPDLGRSHMSQSNSQSLLAITTEQDL